METIFIKNMVCSRCIMVVNQILSKLKLTNSQVFLGSIVFDNSLSDEALSSLKNEACTVTEGADQETTLCAHTAREGTPGLLGLGKTARRVGGHLLLPRCCSLESPHAHTFIHFLLVHLAI